MVSYYLAVVLFLCLARPPEYIELKLTRITSRFHSDVLQHPNPNLLYSKARELPCRETGSTRTLTDKNDIRNTGDGSWCP